MRVSGVEVAKQIVGDVEIVDVAEMFLLNVVVNVEGRSSCD